MKVEINMINVQDGDAIILMLEKNDKKVLILIDGGYKKHYPKIKKRLEEILPNYDNKINLVICTHYDNDHLGGIANVIEDYHDNIQKIWMHKADAALCDQRILMERALEDYQEGEATIDRMQFLAGIKSTKASLVLEGYSELKQVIERLIQYNLEAKIIEPTVGDFLEGFEEFRVVSPSAAFYNSKLDELKAESFINEVKENVLSEYGLILDDHSAQVKLIREGTDLQSPCVNIERNSNPGSVSAPNLVSIVTLLKADGKKYLFTGDAGVESFEKQGILDEDLQDLEWLDLPHHGSIHNTSDKILSHFNPKVVFVSGNGGDNRPHYLIKACLSKKRTGENVHVTNEQLDTWYIKYDGVKIERIPM